MILLAALLACGSPSSSSTLPDGPLADVFIETGGCGDARLYASDGVSTFVRVDVDGAMSGPDVQQYVLPDAAVAMTLQVGENLDDQACTDALMGIDIADSWEATSGRLHLILAPEDGGQRDATVQFIDVVFGDDDPTRTIEYLEFVARLGGAYGG